MSAAMMLARLPRARALAHVMPAALSLALLAGTLPVLANAVLGLAARAAIDEGAKGGSLDEPARAAARAALERAWAVLPRDPRAPDAIAYLLLIGEGPPSSKAETAQLGAAISHLRAALALAPNRVLTWTRLAVALFLEEGASKAAIAALEMSYLLGEREPEALRPRLQLTLAAYDDLPADLVERGLRQLKEEWRFGRSRRLELLTLVRSQPPERQAAIIAWLMADPETAEEAGRLWRLPGEG